MTRPHNGVNSKPTALPLNRTGNPRPWNILHPGRWFRLAQATEAVAVTARRNYELTEAAAVVAVEAAGVEANNVGPIKPTFPR